MRVGNSIRLKWVEYNQYQLKNYMIDMYNQALFSPKIKNDSTASVVIDALRNILHGNVPEMHSNKSTDFTQQLHS